jgi:hypothetical protein
MSSNLMLFQPIRIRNCWQSHKKTKEHYEAGTNVVIAMAANKPSLHCGIRTSNADEC